MNQLTNAIPSIREINLRTWIVRTARLRCSIIGAEIVRGRGFMVQDTDEGATTSKSRLERLQGYLNQDPANPALLLDTADAAITEHKTDVAAQLLARYEQVASLPPHGEHLKGLVALQAGNFGLAEAIFARLLSAGHSAPGLSFNLAWAKAMLGDHAGALALLNDEVVANAPKAPLLKVRMLHHLGRLDDALAVGADLMARYPGDGELAGALSLVAMDADDVGKAQAFAAQGQGQADACCTLGMLALGAQDADKALPLFGKALEQRATHPHAWLGQGLARLALGDDKAAAADLEKAAQLFDRHVGSWIAAGWAYYSRAELADARRCFERALAIDDAFAETQGAIAVLDIVEGRIAEARRRTDVALRLNRQCFSGALALSLLAEHDNNPGLSQKIRERALHVPIGPGGMTIANALLAIARQRTRQQNSGATIRNCTKEEAGSRLKAGKTWVVELCARQGVGAALTV